jgi:hypothetical protein
MRFAVVSDEFLDHIDDNVPSKLDIHIIMENYATRGSTPSRPYNNVVKYLRLKSRRGEAR